MTLTCAIVFGVINVVVIMKTGVVVNMNNYKKALAEKIEIGQLVSYYSKK